MYSIITKDLNKAVAMIKAGRVIAFPTGTSYGLAADISQEYALQRLRNLKKRPAEKAFTVFMSTSCYDQYLNLTPEEKSFLDKNQNQQVTILVKPKELLRHIFSPPARGGVPSRSDAKGGGGSFVGLRVIDHPLMLQLAKAYQAPLTATSANVSGQDPCFSPACIQTQFPGRLDDSTYDLSLGLILGAGELPKNPPSQIIQLVNGQIKKIR